MLLVLIVIFEGLGCLDRDRQPRKLVPEIQLLLESVDISTHTHDRAVVHNIGHILELCLTPINLISDCRTAIVFLIANSQTQAQLWRQGL